jgi:protein-tyrosine phosphatase
MKILMVCLGNICRPTMAEGNLRTQAEAQKLDILIDSAGTGHWHVGNHPDKRAIQIASRFGVDLSTMVARQFSESDFDDFARMYVMDNANYYTIIEMARHDEDRKKVSLLLNADHPKSNREVPDPYFGGGNCFEKVFIMMDKACDAIVEEIEKSITVK